MANRKMKGFGQKFLTGLVKFVNWFTDNGIPIPMIRKNKRGDFTATCSFVAFGAGVFLLILAGNKLEFLGRTFTVPTYDPLVLLAFISPSQMFYVWRRGQDAKRETEMQKIRVTQAVNGSFHTDPIEMDEPINES